MEVVYLLEPHPSLRRFVCRCSWWWFLRCFLLEESLHWKISHGFSAVVWATPTFRLMETAMRSIWEKLSSNWPRRKLRQSWEENNGPQNSTGHHVKHMALETKPQYLKRLPTKTNPSLPATGKRRFGLGVGEAAGPGPEHHAEAQGAAAERLGWAVLVWVFVGVLGSGMGGSGGRVGERVKQKGKWLWWWVSAKWFYYGWNHGLLWRTTFQLADRFGQASKLPAAGEYSFSFSSDLRCTLRPKWPHLVFWVNSQL